MGCDLRGSRQTFIIDDHMSPKRVSRQGVKQHTPPPRSESDADSNSFFPEKGVSLSLFLFHPLVFSKQGKIVSVEGVEGEPY